MQSCHCITGERVLNPVRLELRLKDPHGILKEMSLKEGGGGLREELLQMGMWLRLLGQFGLEMQAAGAVAQAEDMVKQKKAQKKSRNYKAEEKQREIQN